MNHSGIHALRLAAVCVLIAAGVTDGAAQSGPDSDPLSAGFSGGYGQVEAGGWYAGAEFHDSRPLPSRISFFKPVANSVDLSTDYWKRGDSQPFSLGVKTGGRKHRLGTEAWEYVVSPHRVVFRRTEGAFSYEMRYEFCLTQPAVVYTLVMRNNGTGTEDVEAFFALKASLRTCQTYTRKDSALVSCDGDASMWTAAFRDADAGRAVLYVRNLGATPAGFCCDAAALRPADDGTCRWFGSDGFEPAAAGFQPRLTASYAAFIYRRALAPGDSLVIRTAIGSGTDEDARAASRMTVSAWQQDIDNYDRRIREQALQSVSTRTGDAWLDRSAAWARAVLATNAHDLNGTVVPMPCPAEYNFFFTHDVLLTNLAAVQFDPKRVKRDLLYIASLAKDSIIPHAYYWRDDGYKTEFCGPENWNHMWFVQVAASYLRHTGDDSTLSVLYPLVTKSLKEILTQTHEDRLAWSYRPDWWDIGHNPGPRAYCTILTIRALRDYCYLSVVLNRNRGELAACEQTADAMQAALVRTLWKEQYGYLLNYNGGDLDTHYYAGSLLGAAYGLLDRTKAARLVGTAERYLLAPGVGIRTVFPADFSTDAAVNYFKFAGAEAGAPYVYANGGVWQHTSAWYAMALLAAGEKDKAFEFVKSQMTLDGVARSPRGLPAMCEYRVSDPASPEYGTIDKPSFLWAGGFYLNMLYRLFGVSENEWNCSFSRSLPSGLDTVRFSLYHRGMIQCVASGKGDAAMLGTADGRQLPSLVVPASFKEPMMNLSWEQPAAPVLAGINAVLESAELRKNEKTEIFFIRSFTGHRVRASFRRADMIKTIRVDGIESSGGRPDSENVLTVEYDAVRDTQKIEVTY